MEPLLLWKGDTVDSPSGVPNLERSDAGPGVEVPGDAMSHGRDSANGLMVDSHNVRFTRIVDFCVHRFPF